MWGPSLYYLAIALGIVAGGIAFWLVSFPPSSSQDAVATAPAVSSSAVPSAVGSPTVAGSNPAPAMPSMPVRMAAAKRGAASAAPEPEEPQGSDPTTDIT